MEASHISTSLIARPPALDHYLNTNNVLSPSDLSTLEDYLTQLLERIGNLESDITRLQISDDTKDVEMEFLRGEYELCVKTKSSIRQIPQELLGVIFAFAVTTAPFNRFIDVAHLRGVCSSWREAALSTPGIWTDLTIDLGKWCSPETLDLEDQALLHRFESDLKPWLAILSRKPSYHLTLSGKGQTLSRKEEEHQVQFAQCLFSSEPQPGAITLKSPLGVYGVGIMALMGLTCPALRLRVLGTWVADLRSIGSALPNLEALDMWIPLLLEPIPPFRHTSLLTLHLSDLLGQGVHLQKLIQELPSLLELYLSSNRFMKVEDLDLPPITHSHHSLEKLVLNGEDFLFCLRHMSFPSLRLLAIHGHWFTPDAGMRSTDILTKIFSRSPSKPLLVSLRGDFHQSLLIQLIQSFPTRFHLLLDIENEEDEDEPPMSIPIASDNIEAIICGRRTVDLSWLAAGEPARERSSLPLKVYLPTGFEDGELAYSRQEQVRKHGFDLEPLSNDDAGLLLRSLVPQFSEHSADWWDYEIDS